MPIRSALLPSVTYVCKDMQGANVYKETVVLQVQEQLVGAGIKEDLLLYYLGHHHAAWLEKKTAPRLIARPPIPGCAAGMLLLIKCLYELAVHPVHENVCIIIITIR